jgi:glycosyltransferase involved in cell wall biosynthesis
MARVQSTIVVVPRERFSTAPESLESVIATAGCPHAVIYVDAGSPPPIARRLADAARKHDFTLLRCEHYLTPNQARNLALAMVTTKYAALVDNDVMGAPGWLAALENCAEATGAAIVAPVTCIGSPLHSTIHHAGGLARFVERAGQRVFEEKHLLMGERLAERRHELARMPTEMSEFHCVLARTEVFPQLGKLDEKLMASHEHVDFCLTVAGAGRSIYFEPTATVTYVPVPLTPREVPFFMLRWSDEWSRRSVEHFLAKWQAEDARDQKYLDRFIWHHRGYGMPNFRRRAMALCGYRIGKIVIDTVEYALAALARRRAHESDGKIPFTVVHAPQMPGNSG